MANEQKVQEMGRLQSPKGKKSAVSVLSEDSGYRVDFFIYVYKRKRRGQDDLPETFLQSIEGRVEPGTVCAVIGPRNSGKQRLLALLSGRANKHICLGEVRVNGVSYNAPQMRATTSYLIDAGSRLFPQMTVAESVDFVARLVLPGDVDYIARGSKINDVLKEVGLETKANILIENILPEDRVLINLAQVLLEGKKLCF